MPMGNYIDFDGVYIQSCILTHMHVFSTYSCCWYQDEMLFSVMLANPDYCDFASRKIKVNEMLTNRFQLLKYHPNFLI